VKLINAIIQPSQFDTVKNALQTVGVHRLTVTEVNRQVPQTRHRLAAQELRCDDRGRQPGRASPTRHYPGALLTGPCHGADPFKPGVTEYREAYAKLGRSWGDRAGDLR
jgi:hypothetical protein